jgi:hypothetical protein
MNYENKMNIIFWEENDWAKVDFHYHYMSLSLNDLCSYLYNY